MLTHLKNEHLLYRPNQDLGRWERILKEPICSLYFQRSPERFWISEHRAVTANPGLSPQNAQCLTSTSHPSYASALQTDLAFYLGFC